MRPSLLLLTLLAACGAGPASNDAGVTLTDSGVADAGGEPWARTLQPLLYAHCADCHRADGGEVGFAENHALLLQPATRCTGETLGGCVGRALSIQMPEGNRCRTYDVPFHREGWICMTPGQIDQVVSWVDAGMPEH